MHVVIDCRFAFPHLSGIGRYITDLVRALAGHANRPDRITVLTPDPTATLRLLAILGDDRSGLVEAVEFSHSPTSYGSHRPLRKLLREIRADLLHVPDAFAPFFCPCPVVLTIHDLIPLACREFGSHGLKAKFSPLWRAWQKAQCRQASAILTDSAHSLEDLKRYLSPDLEKLRLVYPGVFPPVRNTEDGGNKEGGESTGFLSRHGLSSGRYLLYVGRRDPYKNVAGVIRAVGMLKDSQPDLKLVVAGFPDPRFGEPELEIARYGLQGRVLIAGHLSESEIDTLYRHAAATVLLSYYEGFGYPVVESQLRGTPVVCSPLTSLPEVAGPDVMTEERGSALYADPRNDAEVVDRIGRLLSDPSLRRKLVENGIVNARRFSPEAQASRTLEIYRSVLRKG